MLVELGPRLGRCYAVAWFVVGVYAVHGWGAPPKWALDGTRARAAPCRIPAPTGRPPGGVDPLAQCMGAGGSGGVTGDGCPGSWERALASIVPDARRSWLARRARAAPPPIGPPAREWQFPGIRAGGVVCRPVLAVIAGVGRVAAVNRSTPCWSVGANGRCRAPSARRPMSSRCGSSCNFVASVRRRDLRYDRLEGLQAQPLLPGLFHYQVGLEYLRVYLAEAVQPEAPV